MRRDQQPVDDPLMQHEPADLSAEFRALGYRVRVESNCQYVLGAARSLFGPERDSACAEPAFVLRVIVHHLPEVEGWRPDQQPVLRAQGPLHYAAASRASVMVSDAERRFSFGFISAESAAHTEFLRSTMLQSSFLLMAGAQAISSLHAACVVIGGKAVTLRGQSGAGKTTLAYAVAREGGALLSEDAAFIWNTTSGLEVRGLPWLVYLMPDARRFFPEIARFPIVERFNGEAKIAVEMAKVDGALTAESAPLGPTIVLERRSGGEHRLTRLDEAEARAQLEATKIAVERAEVWRAMLAEGVYRFEVATEPAEAASFLIDRLCKS